MIGSDLISLPSGRIGLSAESSSFSPIRLDHCRTPLYRPRPTSPIRPGFPAACLKLPIAPSTLALDFSFRMQRLTAANYPFNVRLPPS
jgi:hypothetical protein